MFTFNCLPFCISNYNLQVWKIIIQEWKICISWCLFLSLSYFNVSGEKFTFDRTVGALSLITPIKEGRHVKRGDSSSFLPSTDMATVWQEQSKVPAPLPSSMVLIVTNCLAIFTSTSKITPSELKSFMLGIWKGSTSIKNLETRQYWNPWMNPCRCKVTNFCN